MHLGERLLAILNGLPHEVITLLISAFPIVELRGAIPIAITIFHMSNTQALIYGIIGSIIPAIPILYVLEYLEPILRKYNLSYFETSAKTGENVIDMFTSAVEKVKGHRQPRVSKDKEVEAEPIIDLTNNWMILEKLVQENKEVVLIAKEFKIITNEIFKNNPYHQKLEEMTRWRLEKLNPYPEYSSLSYTDREEFLSNLEIWKNKKAS